LLCADFNPRFSRTRDASTISDRTAIGGILGTSLFTAFSVARACL
jgi:hypothetical protein